MARSLTAVFSALAAAWVLAACGGGDRVSRADQARFATPERSVTSPSGRFRLGVVTGEYSGEDGTGEFWRIQIRDRDDRIVLDSPKRFSARFNTEVLWDERLDRAWVNSSDVGSFYWERDDEGRWRKDGLNPEKIWRAEPPPPKLLIERYPEHFGPEGRVKARRLFEEQGPSSGDLDSGISDDDPSLKK